MRVYSQSYWLGIFFLTNINRGLARKRWQTFENSWKNTIFNEHPVVVLWSLPNDRRVATLTNYFVMEEYVNLGLSHYPHKSSHLLNLCSLLLRSDLYRLLCPFVYTSVCVTHASEDLSIETYLRFIVWMIKYSGDVKRIFRKPRHIDNNMLKFILYLESDTVYSHNLMCKGVVNYKVINFMCKGVFNYKILNPM